MNTRQAETSTVKAALIRAGYADVKVSHGTGTAHGWLHVKVSTPAPGGCSCTVDPSGIVETCPACQVAWQAHYHRAIEITQGVTGRRGEYDCIGADVRLA